MFASLHVRRGGDAQHIAHMFSPRVERTAPDTWLLDVAGLERIFGLPQEIAAALARQAAEAGLECSVAVAANPDTAFHAARGFRGISVVPQGDEAKFLGELPLALLSPSPELLETLERWGIRRFRDLAALPPIGLAERLGDEGLRLWRLARGENDRPLRPLDEPLAFAEELELEYPVELLEPLLFVLSRMLNGLTLRLAARGLATNELRLALALETGGPHERALRLPVPMLDARAFLKLLQLELATHPPPAAVTRVRLEGAPVEPRTAQNGLFVPLAPEPEKLEITLARVRALVGESNVGSPALPDTHRPDAFVMRAFSGGIGPRPVPSSPVIGYRRFRPPRPAQVRTSAAGRPAHVASGEIRGAVLTLAGPWRSSGDWWTRAPWNRDEWDVLLADGAVYRMYVEAGQWFLDGSYD